MKVRLNRRHAEFVSKLRHSSFPRKPWKGVTFRSAVLEFASPAQILSGQGSFLFGGRWNAPGSFPVIYTSTRPGTAVEEAYQLANDFQLAPNQIRPRVTCGIQWELSSMIDLTTAGLPPWLELDAWLKEDFEKINDGGSETLCQAFGRAARDCRIIAMMCPSVRVRHGVNLVVFRDRLPKSDTMRVLAKEELAKHLA